MAQPAIQGGKYVAKVINADVKGKRAKVKPFKYLDKGTMATIGRASAIAEIKYLPRLKGFPAWVIWIGLHVVTLLGNRNRFATLINLSAKYLSKGSHNAIVGETPPIAAQEPHMVESRNPPKPVKKAEARKAAAAQATEGHEGIKQS